MRTFFLFLLLLCSLSLQAQPPVERNHIYGMFSGTALLMDVYQPVENVRLGKGIVFVLGSGWYAQAGYDTPGLKEMRSGWQPGDELAHAMVDTLVAEGFTVFVPNHRAAPEYRYPAALDDIARAAAYVREQAGMFGIDAERIGGAGASSGGALVSLLGVMDTLPQASRLQAIATQAAPMDLVSLYFSSADAAGTLATYIGHSINFLPPEHPEYQRYVDASSASHIGPGDAPHLLIHGTDDELVPFGQSETALHLFAEAGVSARLYPVEHGMHSEHLLGENDGWLKAMASWLRDQL